MIINTQVKVFKPRDVVWDYFNNPQNVTEWVTGLKEYQPTTGEHGKAGSKAKLTFKERDRKIVMSEEILVSKPPSEHTAKFSSKDLDMIINYQFDDDGKETTTLTCSSEYKFRSLLLKVVSKLFLRSKLKDRQQQDLKNFKELVELTVASKS